MAPFMMSDGAEPMVSWLITSDSAKTAQTPDISTGTVEEAASGPISSVE